MVTLNSQIKLRELILITIISSLLISQSTQNVTQKCKLTYLVTPQFAFQTVQESSQITSYDAEVDLGPSNYELSFFLKFKFGGSTSGFLSIADIAILDTSRIIKNYLKIQFNLEESQLEIFYRNSVTSDKKETFSISGLQDNEWYYLAMGFHFGAKLGHVFLKKDLSGGESKGNKCFSDGMGIDLFSGNGNENVQNVHLNTGFSIENFLWERLNDVGSINVVLGCIRPPHLEKLFCSNVEFPCFAFINQYFSKLQNLPLISSDMDSYAEFYLHRPDSTNTVISPKNSYGLYENLTLSSTKILQSISKEEKFMDQFQMQSMKYTIDNLLIENSVTFWFEVGFGIWNSQGSLGRSTSGSSREFTLFDLQTKQGNSLIKLKIKESSALDRDLPSDSILQTVMLQLEIQNSPIEMSNPILLSSTKNLTSFSKQPQARNSKFALFIQQPPKGGISIRLLKINPTSLTGENLISASFHYSDNQNSLPLSSVQVQVLSDFVNRLSNFELSRFMISDSLGSLLSFQNTSQISNISDECKLGCLLGEYMLDRPQYRSDVVSRAFKVNAHPQMCWACRGSSVFQTSTGACVDYCGLSTFNKNGNCVACEMENCARVQGKLSYKLGLSRKEGKSLLELRPSIGYLNFGSRIYEDNFDVFESVNGGRFVKKPYTVSVNQENQAGILQVESSSIRNKRLDQLTYRVQLKPGAQIIDQNQNLVYSDPLYASTTLNNTFSAPVVAPVSNVMRIPGNVTKSHSNLMVDKKYSKCFSFFSDKVLNNFAIAFYVFYVFIIILFVVFVLFFWNKFLPFQLNNAITHLFVSCMCMFQAIVFCVFYEVDLPPTLDLFLRHLYRISTYWHGAFRNRAVVDYRNSEQFNYNYFRMTQQKPYELSVVQNIFINYGIMILILAVLWLVAIALYFIFLKLKKTPTSSLNQNQKKTISMQNQNQNQPELFDDMLHKNTYVPSFMQRLALSFAFLLVTALSLAFTVEVIYYIIFEFHKARPNHILFQISLVFAIFFFICHVALILWVLAYPFRLLSEISKLVPRPPLTNSPNYKENLKIYETSMKVFKAYHSNIIFFNFSNLREKHAPYHWLFIVQGLKLKLICPFFLGITCLLYFFYAVFLVVLQNPPKAAVIANFVIVTLLMLQALFFPFVNTIENIFLIIGYILFWIAYVLLLVLSVGKFSYVNVCHLGLAIAALMFLGWLMLMFGIIEAMIRICRFIGKTKGEYSAQHVERYQNTNTDERYRKEREGVRGEATEIRDKSSKTKKQKGVNSNFQNKIKNKTFSEDIDKSFKSGGVSQHIRNEEYHRTKVQVDKHVNAMDSNLGVDQTTDRGTNFLMPDVQSEEVTHDRKNGHYTNQQEFDTFRDKNSIGNNFSTNRNLLNDNSKHIVNKTTEYYEINKEETSNLKSRVIRKDNRLKSMISEIREEIDEGKSQFDGEDHSRSELDYKMHNVQQLSQTRNKSKNKFHERYRKSRKYRNASPQKMRSPINDITTKPLKIETDVSKSMSQSYKDISQNRNQRWRRTPERRYRGEYEYQEPKARITQKNKDSREERRIYRDNDQVLGIRRLQEEAENPFNLDDSSEREIVFKNKDSQKFGNERQYQAEEKYYVKEQRYRSKY